MATKHILSKTQKEGRDEEQTMTRHNAITDIQTKESPWNDQQKQLQSNLNSTNIGGSFTMDNSNSFLRNSSDSSTIQIFREIFVFYHKIVCCVYSLESPRRGDSIEYTQHTIIV